MGCYLSIWFSSSAERAMAEWIIGSFEVILDNSLSFSGSERSPNPALEVFELLLCIAGGGYKEFAFSYHV